MHFVIATHKMHVSAATLENTVILPGKKRQHAWSYDIFVYLFFLTVNARSSAFAL
jgi:hypothetical protein